MFPFFNHYPGSNLHEIDLAYILKLCENLETNNDALVSWKNTHEAQYDALKNVVDGLVNNLVDVIVPWDSSIAYHIFSIVEYQGTNYIAVQDVPVGAMITDTNYWQPANTVIEQINAIGTVVSDLQDSLIYTTPEEYGAIGDGVTDDTTALQDALNDGRPVYLKGSYLVTIALDIEHDAFIFGDGSITANISGSYLFVPDASGYNVYVSGISFDFVNASYGLISAANYTNKLHVTDCTFEHATTYIPGAGYIAQTAALNVYAHDAYVSRNKFIDNAGHCVQLRASAQNAKAAIINNYIDSMNSEAITGLTSAYGIGCSQDATYKGYYDEVKIVDNYVCGVLGSCISGHFMDHMLITGNRCDNTRGEHGIVIQDSEDTIVANNIVNCHDRNGVCFRVQRHSALTKNILICNNIGLGRFCSLGGWDVSNVTVKNNFCYDPINRTYSFCQIFGFYGNQGSTSDHITIEDNTIECINVVSAFFLVNMPAHELYVGYNTFNGKKIYGVGWTRTQILESDIEPEHLGVTNDVAYTVNYGTLDGTSFATDSSGFAMRLRVNAADFDYTKNPYLGFTFVQGVMPNTMRYGITFYSSSGSLGAVNTNATTGHTDGVNTNGRHSFIFDLEECYSALNIDPANITYALVSVFNSLYPVTAISFSDVHVFKGQRCILE